MSKPLSDLWHKVWPDPGAFVRASAEDLERFAELVCAEEREKWAKFCETHIVWVGRGGRGLSELSAEEFANGGTHQGMDYADAIRNRSKT